MLKDKEIEEEPINFSKLSSNFQSQKRVIVDEEQKLDSKNTGEVKLAKNGIPKIVFIVVGIVLAVAIIVATVLIFKKSPVQDG